jgi:hypothetical protein
MCFPGSGARWSLFEMINFRFGTSNDTIRNIGLIIRASNSNMEVASQFPKGAPERIIDDEWKKETETAIKASRILFSELNCPHVEAAIRSIESRLRHNMMTWSELNTCSRRLRDALEIELAQHFFFRYEKVKGRLLFNWKNEWAAVVKAFPNVERDAFSATDCYALGHDTASVFHSMRVAEHGLRAIAREREIKLKNDKPIEWATWMDIIKELDNQISLIVNKRAGQVRDEAQEFYSGLRADLNGFKDEYRNSVSHVRKEYDEFEALRALTKVREFMERLSARITYKATPINWQFI